MFGQCSVLSESLTDDSCNSVQLETGPAITMDIIGGNGGVIINGKTLKKNTRILLKGGDEIVFQSKNQYSFVSLCNSCLRFALRYLCGYGLAMFLNFLNVP